MKKSLGSPLLIMMSLWGDSDYFDFNLSVDNPHPFVKEGVTITFKAHQKNHKNTMFFELTPPHNKSYKLQLIDKKDNISAYHDKYITYRYRLYPLKEGNISLPFTLQVATVSDESVKTFVTGSWDEVNPMAKTTYNPKVPPIILQVQPIKAVDLVGDFTLTESEIPPQIDAYKQLNILYTLKGEGYPNIPKQLLKKQKDVEAFLELRSPNPQTHLYNYALVAEHVFTLPAITLHAFSPKKNRYYTLQTKAHHIAVTPLKQEEILDKKENFPSKSPINIVSILNALLLFVAGYLTAIFKPLSFWKKTDKQDNPLKKEIQKSNDAKTLLKLLLSHNNQVFKPYIQELEALLYHDKPHKLQEIKDQLLKQL